jgi:uncharacterized membrane protein YbhN (UPF0104 family)
MATRMTRPSGWMRRAASTTWLRRAARLIVGIGVLIAVIAHVGTAPFLHGILSVDGSTIGAAVLLTAVATGAAAWRWRVVAIGLGIELRWPTAVAMYYRSQFLNTVLPGGIVGDVHRAIAHGQREDNLGQGARAVAIERICGQLVQVGMALVVLSLFWAEFNRYVLVAVAIGLSAAIAATVLAASVSVRCRMALLREARELRAGIGSTFAGVQVTVASMIVVCCHVATFAIATTAVGERVPPAQLVSLALIILLGASIPLNIGGWGPREGIAGWAFAVAGFGASAGVAASTLFGVLTIIAVAPGAIALVVFAAHGRADSRSSMPSTPRESSSRVPVLTARDQEKSS